MNKSEVLNGYQFTDAGIELESSQEFEATNQESVAVLHELCSDSGREKFEQHLEEQLKDFGAEVSILSDDREQQVTKQVREQSEKGNFDVANKIRADYDAEKEKIEPSVRSAVKDINNKLYSLEVRGEVELTGEEGTSLLSDLINGAPNQFTNRSMEFSDTIFMDGVEKAGQNKMLIILPRGEQVNIPRSMFVSAQSFESWRGRAPGILKDGKMSSEVIEDYASQDAETAPALTDISIIVNQKGEVIVNSANAHRVGAALRRGDESVTFEGNAKVYFIE